MAVFTCPKHKDRNEFILRWIPEKLPKNIKFFFVYGDSDENKVEGNNLYLKCPERYEFFTEKVYECLNYFYSQDIDYLVKLDNDTHILDFSKFINSVRRLEKESIDFAATMLNGAEEEGLKEYLRSTFFEKKEIPKEYRGRYTGILPDYWFLGHCYILNKKSIKILLDRFNETYEHKKPITEVCEDVLISHILFSRDDLNFKQIGRLNVSHKTCTCGKKWCILRQLSQRK